MRDDGKRFFVMSNISFVWWIMDRGFDFSKSFVPQWITIAVGLLVLMYSLTVSLIWFKVYVCLTSTGLSGYKRLESRNFPLQSTSTSKESFSAFWFYLLVDERFTALDWFDVDGLVEIECVVWFVVIAVDGVDWFLVEWSEVDLLVLFVITAFDDLSEFNGLWSFIFCKDSWDGDSSSELSKAFSCFWTISLNTNKDR